MSLLYLDKSLLREASKKAQDAKSTVTEEEISDESLDLFKKVFAKEMEDKDVGKDMMALLDAADKKIVKDLYSDAFKETFKGADLSKFSKTELLDDWHKSLNISAKATGAIDKFDQKTIDMMLKEQTFDQPRERYGIWDGLKIGFRNQIEGVQYAGIAAIAGLKNDPSYYAKRAGGTMAENADNVKWSEVLGDLLWMADTGSETGGKMFVADLAFLLTSPIKVPIRMALGMTTKAVLKQGGKTVAKNVTKKMTKEAVEAAIKSGARMELKGIGAKVLEKDLQKMAVKMTKEQLEKSAKAGIKKSAVSLQTDLIAKNKAKIIMDGLSTSYKVQNSLKNTALAGLDLINIPLGINTREIIKGMMGYGIPVLSGASESIANVAEYFTQSGNKLTRLYAQHNVTEYEKQLAKEFVEMTGANPLEENFENKESWEAYRNFKIRNEGMASILLGKKEGWGQFWNFFADTAVNMTGMSMGVKATTAASSKIGSKLSIGGVADLTKQINDIKNSNKYGIKLDLEPTKELIAEFTKDIEAIDFKKGGTEPLKLINRANDLVEAVFKKSAGLMINNPELTSKIAILQESISNSKFDSLELPEKIKKIVLVSNEILGELEVGVNKFHLFRESAELTKIVDYFKELETQKDFTSRMKLAVARNLGKGSSSDVRTYFGGISTAEAFANKNPFFADYFLNKALSAGEIAKSVAFQRELDLKTTQFLGDLAIVKNGELRESGFVKTINAAVGEIVDSYFKGGNEKDLATIKKSLVSEGVTKVLEVYNTFSTSELKSNIDFGAITKEILTENFGEKVLNTAAGIKNTTIGEFLKTDFETSEKKLANLIKKSFESPDSLFHPESKTLSALTERYRGLSKEGRGKIRQLAETQKKLYDVFYRDLAEARQSKAAMDELLMIKSPMPEANGASYDVGSKNFKTLKGAQAYAQRLLEKKVIEFNKEVLKDPNSAKAIITKTDIDNFMNDNFDGVVKEQTSTQKMLNKQVSHLQEVIKKAYYKENAGDLEILKNLAEEKSVNEDGSELVNTADKTANDYISKLKEHSSLMGDKLILSKTPKMSDIVKLSKVTNNILANVLNLETDKNLRGRISGTNEAINKITTKIENAKNVKEVKAASLELINKLIKDINGELETAKQKGGDLNVMSATLERLKENKLSLQKSIELNKGRSSNDQFRAIKQDIDSQIDSLDKNIDTVRDLALEASKALEVKRQDVGVIKGIEKSIEKLESQLSMYLKEQDSLLGQRDDLVKSLYVNPLSKEALSELAKGSKTVDEFYSNLGKSWKENFKIDIPKELVDKESLTYKSIYNILKQTSTEPRKTLALEATMRWTDDGKFYPEYDMKITESPRLVNGLKLQTSRVESKAEKIAKEKNWQMIETSSIESGGKNVDSLADLVSFRLRDQESIDKYGAAPELKTAQDYALMKIAQDSSSKIHIGKITNDVAKLNAMSASEYSFKTDTGEAVFLRSEQSFKSDAESSQGTIDGVINQKGANIVYNTMLNPFRIEAEKRGLTLIASIDPEGKRLLLTPTRDNDVNKTFSSFMKDVLSIDAETIKTENPLKRVKQMFAAEIHADEKSVNKTYREAKMKRNVDKNNNIMFRGIFIDDELHNKVTLKEGNATLDITSTDGQTYLSKFLMDIFRKEMGLKKEMGLDDKVIKASAYIPGNDSWILKMMGMELRQSEANKSYFDVVEKVAGTRNINDLELKYDLFVTKSTAKALGLKFQEGAEFDMSIDSLSVKRLDNSLRNEVSGAMQLINSIPRIISGNPKWTKIYDKAMESVVGMFNEELKEFASVLQKINIDKPGAVDTLINSRLFKDISGDDFMSKAIDDIRANGGLKNLNKAAFTNHIMKVYRDKVIRMQFQGSDTHLIGIGDYNSLEKAVVKNFKGQGVTAKNFIILDKTYWKDRVYYNNEGLPEVFTYRYPVNKASNMTVPKVIWSDHPAIKDLVGDIGNKALLNMHDVFINKEGDFDIDKINIVNDPRLKGDFLNMIKAIEKEKSLNFITNIKDKTIRFKDLFIDSLNPTSEKPTDSDIALIKEEVDVKLNYYGDLLKLTSKHSKFTIDSLIDQFVRGRQLIEQNKMLTTNKTSGKSFIERLYYMDGVQQLMDSKITINSNIERLSESYANKGIVKNISTKNIANNTAINTFNELNYKLASELAPVYTELNSIKSIDFSNDHEKVKLVVEKGTHGDVFRLDGYKELNPVLDYHNKVVKMITEKLDLERDEIRAKDKYNKTKYSYVRQKRGALNVVTQRIDELTKGQAVLESNRNQIIQKYETEAILKIKPDMESSKLTSTEAKDLQRYIMSKPWGSTDELKVFNSKASFLVSPEIRKEYNNLYNEKYIVRDLSETFGIRISENDTQKIKIAFNDVERLKNIGADEKTIAEAIQKIDDTVEGLVNNKIASSKVLDKALTVEDLKNTGRFSGILEGILFKDLDGNPLKDSAISLFRLHDVYDIKESADMLLKSNPAKMNILSRGLDQNKKFAIDLNKEIKELESARNKEFDYSKVQEMNKSLESKKNELKMKTAEVLVGSYMESISIGRTTAAVASASGKADLISDGVVKDAERVSDNSKYKAAETDKLINNLSDELVKAESTLAMLEKLTEANKLQSLELERIADPFARQVEYEKHAVRVKEIVDSSFAKLMLNTAKSIAQQDSNHALKNYDALSEMKKLSIETNKELTKASEVEPYDILSHIFETATKTYKNVSVGMAIGRAVNETLNAGIINYTEKISSMLHGGISDKDFKNRFKSLGDIVMPKPNPFGDNAYQEFIMKDFKGMPAAKQSKILNNFNKTMTNIAGFVSNKFINVLPNKMANDYYDMQFRKALYNEVSKNDGIHRQKTYMLKDPATLSWQDRQQYYSTMRFLEEVARKDTEKAFFNYAMNPLLVHKLETAIPFSNFLFSGFRLMKKHPQSILGANVIFRSLINNYGEQVGFVLDDEDGDPVRVDYGKKLKLPLLNMYAGGSINLDRMLQFSPSDTKLGVAPIFSYMTGDSDWRVKKWLDGEMSGIELVAGAISPSISQLAAGIIEDDYQKRYSGLSYLMTGFAAKSGAHAKVANDFYIKQDYESVKKAPASVKRHLFDQFNKKGVSSTEFDDATLDALIEAQNLGLLSKPAARNSFGVYQTENGFKDAIKLNGMMMTLAANGHTDPNLDKDDYKKIGRDVFELTKWVTGKTFFDNIGDDDWLKNVEKFAKAGHLEKFKAVNKAYGEAMEHYYENREYYASLTESRNIAYNINSSENDQLKAKAKLLALKYEVAGAGQTVDSKAYALMNGTAQFLLDENGAPVLTKERIDEIDYRGFFVSGYEDVVSKHEMFRDTREFYLSMYNKAKADKDSKLKTYAWNMSEHNRLLMNASYKELEQEFNIEADIYDLKRRVDGKTPTVAVNKNGTKVYVTQPIENYMDSRSKNVNDYLNKVAENNIHILENTDLKWGDLTNRQKSVFMANNNGKTINQARVDVANQIKFFEGLKDTEVPQRTSNNIKLIQSLYE